jgi:branched-subunit amino acid ABC-type transport system permease component
LSHIWDYFWDYAEEVTIGQAGRHALTTLLHSVGFGLVTASIVALASVAFSLQFSVTTTPNFAHGDLLTAGAYGALVAQQLTNNVILEVLAAVVVGAAVASILNAALIQPFLRIGAKRLSIFLVTVAFGWILQNILLMIFGGTPSPYLLPQSSLNSVGPFLWTTTDETIMAATLVILLLLHIMMRYTKFGKSLRAVSDNPQLARVTGINYMRVVQITWAIDGALAGFAGFVLAAYVGSLTPTIGFTFLVVIFAASVIGGLGRPYGTLVGALIIGLAMEVSASYLPAEYKQAVAFGLLIIALLVRPRGIFTTEVWNFAE